MRPCLQANDFPLPSERKSEPRFDGAYRDADLDELRFASDGTVRWNAGSGEWRVHGQSLRVRTASRDCEGAIGGEAVHLLCAEGEGRDARSQVVLTFMSDG